MVDRADDRLAALVHMHMLDSHRLLALAAVFVEGFEQASVGSAQFDTLIDIGVTALEGLILEHGTSVALHRRLMRNDHLGGEHGLGFVPRRDPMHRGHDAIDGGLELFTGRKLRGVQQLFKQHAGEVFVGRAEGALELHLPH